MKKTSKKSTVTISVAAFVILLLGIGLLVWVLPARNAEKEESAATPPESTVHETALSAPATQKENAESTNADTSEHTTTSEQEPIDEEKKPEEELAAAYQAAEELLAAGNREAAYKAFMALEDYRDSKQRADTIYESVTGRDVLANASIGDIVVFGTYEQDGNRTNGSEWIEWLVLDKEEDRILVISKYGLSSQAYNANANPISITWVQGKNPADDRQRRIRMYFLVGMVQPLLGGCTVSFSMRNRWSSCTMDCCSCCTIDRWSCCMMELLFGSFIMRWLWNGPSNIRASAFPALFP